MCSMGSIRLKISNIQAAVAGQNYYFEIVEFDFGKFGHFKTMLAPSYFGCAVNFDCSKANFTKADSAGSEISQLQVVLDFKPDFVGFNFGPRAIVTGYLREATFTKAAVSGLANSTSTRLATVAINSDTTGCSISN